MTEEKGADVAEGRRDGGVREVGVGEWDGMRRVGGGVETLMESVEGVGVGEGEMVRCVVIPAAQTLGWVHTPSTR